MNKGLGAASKRNRIANYMDALPEEFEVVDDNLGEEDPSIKLQTKTRVITLSCDSRGNVQEEFQMREGAGSKEDYLVKQEAYNAIQAYYNDYYTGAKLVKNSFDEGELKIELEGRVVTLTYDSLTKSVEEKDRVKRKVKEKQPKQKATREKNTDETEFKQLSLFDIVEAPIESGYEKWADGIIVKNICNNKKYKVKHDNGNIIEVFDNDHGYLIMARADLKIVDMFNE